MQYVQIDEDTDTEPLSHESANQLIINNPLIEFIQSMKTTEVCIAIVLNNIDN